MWAYGVIAHECTWVLWVLVVGCCACFQSLYHTALYHTISYHTMPCHTIPYHTVPYHTIPYHTIPYHTIPEKEDWNICNTVANVDVNISPHGLLSFELMVTNTESLPFRANTTLSLSSSLISTIGTRSWEAEWDPSNCLHMANPLIVGLVSYITTPIHPLVDWQPRIFTSMLHWNLWTNKRNFVWGIVICEGMHPYLSGWLSMSGAVTVKLGWWS